MADYKFTPTESIGARLGTGFGQGIGQGLEAIAQAKMQQLQQNRQAQDLATLLKLPINEAQAISRLGIDKDKLLNTLARYGGMPSGAGIAGIEQGAKPSTGEVPFAERFAKPSAEQKPLTPAQEKQRDTVTAGFINHEQIIQAANDAISKLESGDVSLGFIPNIRSGIYPGGLNQATQDFMGDIANIVNLRTEGLKGLMSKYRIANIERDKPALNLSKQANINRLNRIKKESEHKIAQIRKDHPNYQFESVLGQVGQTQQPQGLEAGARLEGLPKPGTPEFDRIPENGGIRKGDVMYVKRGNGYIKKKA
jgi:hypothetical protein